MKSILCALLMLAGAAHASGFQYTITSQAGHHEYDSRSADVCNLNTITPTDLTIGCGTPYHTQPLVYPQYSPHTGEGDTLILVAYTASEVHGQLLILEFDGCWIEDHGDSFLVATCASSSDDGFVDGFEQR